MIARSLRPMALEVSIESRSCLVSSAERMGVFPFFTTCFGPRTEEAGFEGTTWPTTSQSKSIRIVARCCLTEGFERLAWRPSM